jgi:hypothetical protein
MTSCGSSYPTSWINSVKRIVADSSNVDLCVEDIEGDETLAEETSSASATISSNPSTSSTSSLPRKVSSNVTKLKVDQISPTKKMSMVPRPTAERVGRRNSVEEELSFSPKKFNRFDKFSFFMNY